MIRMTQDMWQTTTGTVNRAIDTGTTMAADRVEHYGSIVRETVDTLRERGEPQAAQALDQVASLTTSVANYLRTVDGTRLLADAEDFTRGRAPLMTAIGAVTGFALARAIRAGAARRTYDALDSTWNKSDYDQYTYGQPAAGQTGMRR